jgi:hypothetical protein
MGGSFQRGADWFLSNIALEGKALSVIYQRVVIEI